VTWPLASSRSDMTWPTSLCHGGADPQLGAQRTDGVMANVMTLVFLLAVAAVSIWLASVAYGPVKRPPPRARRSMRETGDKALVLGA
jgi:hypothetical protein